MFAIHRYSVEFQGGTPEILSVMRLNSYYRFYEACDSRSLASARVCDDSYIIFSVEIRVLVFWFRFFTTRDLHTVSRFHGIIVRNLSKRQLIESILSHWCSDNCRSTIYVFKVLPRIRRNVESNFSQLLPVTDLSLTASEEDTPPTSSEAMGINDSDAGDVSEFDHLSVPDRDFKANIIRRWQEETSTIALKRLVCAVCAIRAFKHDTVWVFGTSVELSILRNELLPENILPRGYNLIAYNYAILNTKGLEFLDRVGHIRICLRCLKALNAGIMPKFALSNWLYYGIESLPSTIREHFQNSSLFDRMLVSQARCNSICCKFNPRGTEDPITSGNFNSENNILTRARKGIKGNVMVLPLDVVRMNDVLPPTSESIKDTMCAIFVNDKLPTKDTIARFGPILVRKSRVKSMITFLLDNNPHYTPVNGFGFSEENLNRLFDDGVNEGVPSSVHIGHIPSNDAIQISTSDYTPRNNSDGLVPTESDELLMENVGYTEGDDSPLSYHTMKEIALQRCLHGKPFIVSGSGNRSVFDFNNPSILTWLFPHLDPWGIGGFHHPGRTKSLNMEEQVSHLLQVDDSPFERDPEFAFVFYNVVRKATVSKTLRFTIPQRMHESVLRDLMSIDPETLITLNRVCRDNNRYRAENDEERKAFRLLQNLRMVARHVPNSDGYKIMLRNQIRGMISNRGTPTLFMTLNPSDVDNPIVRLFSGEDINLEDIARGEDMTSWRRKLLAARNPAACALFFDLMIRKFIEVILCYNEPEGGLYGQCDAYFGTVEAQGKGTLHCHMLIWLKGHASPQKLRDLMNESEAFKLRQFSWIESVVKCEFPSAPTDTSIQIERSRRILHTEMANPHPGTLLSNRIPCRGLDLETYWADYEEDLNQLLYEYNWHDHQATCWKYLKRGQEKSDKNCRMGLDGTTRETTCLDPSTSGILLRRRHPKIAPYTDIVTFLMRCNTDIKFVGSGEAAKAFLYYVTDYITKPSLPVHVGMTALSYAVKKLYARNPELLTSGNESEKTRAVIIAVNSMMGRQEISHPQVLSYLIGGGDHYTSEKFAILQWGAIYRYVQAKLRVNEDGIEQDSDTATLNLSFSNSDDTRPTVSNQQLDYSYRSVHSDYDSLSIYDFVSRTSKQKYPTQSASVPVRAGAFDGQGHPQQQTHFLTLKTEARIPVILGPSFSNPKTSDESKENWSREMLVLFKPWRDTTTLKTHTQSWSDAFEVFHAGTDERTRQLISNITVLTECSDARASHGRGQENESPTRLDEDRQYVDERSLYPENMDPYAFGMIRTEGNNQDDVVSDKHLSGLIGHDVTRILDMCLPSQTSDGEDEEFDLFASLIVDNELANISEHSAMMTLKRKRRQIEDPMDNTQGEIPTRRTRISRLSSPFVDHMLLEDSTESNYVRFAKEKIEHVIGEMNLEGNEEQLRAFKTIAEHLIHRDPTQLLLHIAGVGGTGKSHVIKSIVKLFNEIGRRTELLLGAPTGIAAVLIGGQTLHSLIMLSPSGKKRDIKSLLTIWKGVRYLIIDEVSMLGARFLSILSSRMREAKGDDPLMSGKPFGGVNVIFFGDFAQLKPPKQFALYSYEIVKNPSFAQARDERGISAMNGAFLWRIVSKVVQLVRNQRHASDPAYSSFLDRLRMGQCLRDGCGRGLNDLDYIRARTLQNIAKHPVELASFSDAPIIVGSKVLRDALNTKLVSYYSRRLNSEICLYHSRDNIKSAAVRQSVRSVLWDIPSTINKESFGRLPLFVGMKVMVTENIAFDHGIVNGSEGVVYGIKYEEKGGIRYAVVVYVHIPGCGVRARDLPDDVVPIFPVATHIDFKWLQTTSVPAKGFTRKQIPLVPAYVYTDFKSQGRTLEKVIVDLATARGQGVYVMLSRVKSLTGLAILRWFPPTKIYGRLPQELREELARLQSMSAETKI